MGRSVQLVPVVGFLSSRSTWRLTMTTTTDLLSQIRAKAQEGIARRLFADATRTDAELRVLGADIAAQCAAVPLFGPIKQQGRASEKVRGDYGGDWYDLKDAVRMTIVAPTAVQLKKVGAMIRSRCGIRNGFGLIKDDEKTAETSPCGYSGLNFVITMSNGRPAEIQANIPEVMYGQLSEQCFRDTLGHAKFFQIKGRYWIDGGFGHGLYEIYRVAPASVKGKRAALVSKLYFNYLRGFPNRSVYNELAAETAAIVKANPNIFHH
jgi:hypothetical protein